jgi:hypothetical protein
MSNQNDFSRAPRSYRGSSSGEGISTCSVVGIIAGIAVLGMIVTNLPGLFRYIKISSM